MFWKGQGGKLKLELIMLIEIFRSQGFRHNFKPPEFIIIGIYKTP